MASPDPAALERLGGLLADGTQRVPIQATYGLDHAPENPRMAGQYPLPGKLAISV